MENQIPLPTDNIYKFYALFGLLLLIFSFGSIIYLVHSTNDFAFKTHVEIATIKQMATPTEADVVKRTDLEALLQGVTEDRTFSIGACGVFIGIAILLMLCGFTEWQTKVQPIQDEIAKLQLEKLRHEVKQLARQIESRQTPDGG